MKVLGPRELAATLSALPARPRIVAGGNGAVPKALLSLVDESIEEMRLFVLNAPLGIPARRGIVHETAFVGPGMRHSPTLSYVPARLSLVPRLFGTTLLPDVVCVTVSPPQDGLYSLGTEVNVLPAAIEACRARGGIVIAQVSTAMPWTYGDGVLGPEAIDYALESDEPLDVPHARAPDDASRRIGELVSGRVADGSTLQLGIGLVPDAALPGLTARRGLAIWSEMFSDGVLLLDRAGALDPSVDDHGSFILGSRELYAWVHRNPRVQVLRTERTNAPSRIAAHRAMTSINTALQVDLFGQANASRIRRGSTPASGGRPTSSSVPCTPAVARR